VDSLQEESRFEPPVPLARERVIFRREKGPEVTGVVSRDVLSFMGDQRFESAFLQQRVSVSRKFGLPRREPGMAFSIVSALFDRVGTGKGRRLQVAMQDSVMHYSRGGFITQARTGKAAPRRPPANNPPGGIYPCKLGGPNDYVYLLTSRANPEHWPRLLKLIGREDLIGDARYEIPDARMKCEAEVDEIVASWTRQRTKHE